MTTVHHCALEEQVTDSFFIEPKHTNMTPQKVMKSEALNTKNRRLFYVVAALCMILLSGCGGGGGGGGTSISADQQAFNAGYVAYNGKNYSSAAAAFQSMIVTYPSSSLLGAAYHYLGKSLYHLNDFSAAIAKFDIVLTNYPLNAFADNSLLWKGKSLQRLASIQLLAGNVAGAATLFADARAAYLLVISSYPSTTLVPDCRYQIGLSYYDEKRYAEARPLLLAVVTSYPISSVADGAQYYYARSIHALALTATPGYTFDQARTEYTKLMSSYPASSWVDNAQFQIGKTYYDQLNYATALVEFNKVFNYAAATSADEAQYYIGRSYHKLLDYINARVAYGLVVTKYPTSIFVDNASYHSAYTYHDSTQCTPELTAMQAFVLKYSMSPMSTLLVATANTHISDLVLVPPVTHTPCF